MAIHVYHEEADQLREVVLRAAPEREVIAWSAPAALRAGLHEVQILFAALPPSDGWERATRLRLIQLMGVGVDTLLPAPSLPASVEIAGMRGAFAAEVSEHGIAMLLALVRGLPTLLERQRAQTWRPFASRALAGDTACVVGVGEIGSRLARALGGLGMRVVGVARHARPLPHFAEVLGSADLHVALRAARVVFVACPLTPQTRALVDAAALAALPRGAFVVALSRGAIVDETALLTALHEGRLGGAALDVFASEPLSAGHGLWKAPNTIVTPHLAGIGVRYIERAVTELLANVDRLERGLRANHRVDREAGY